MVVVGVGLGGVLCMGERELGVSLLFKGGGEGRDVVKGMRVLELLL